jgi:hypothetical protein
VRLQVALLLLLLLTLALRSQILLSQCLLAISKP